MRTEGFILEDRRLRVADHAQLGGRVLLPKLPGVEPLRDPFFDRIGRVVNQHGRLLLDATIGGAALGAATASLTDRGWLGTAAATVVGGVGGLAGAVFGGALLDSIRDGGNALTRRHVKQVEGAKPAPGATRPEHLRVMDWNIRELIGPRGKQRRDNAALDAVVASVKANQPDVLLLQEVANKSIDGNYLRDNLQELAHELGATDAVLVPNGFRVTGREKGTAVFTFGGAEIEDARGLRHPDAPREGFWNRIATGMYRAVDRIIDLPAAKTQPYRPRTTADAIVRTQAGNAVRLLNVHLSGTAGNNGGTPGSPAAQERQLKPLLATLDAWTGPTIIAGDFNVHGGSTLQSYESQLMRQYGMRDAFGDVGIRPGSQPTRTYPAPTPHSAIDRLYVDRTTSVGTAAVLTGWKYAEGSDHLPMLFDLQLGSQIAERARS